jgi:ubiquinone biosynthesis protein
MNQQIGLRGLLERLKKEGPRYVQLLPELPRLVHRNLQRNQPQQDASVMLALLAEQRRTNRLLRRLVYGAILLALLAIALLVVFTWSDALEVIEPYV